jgi:ribonuclease D
LYTSPPDYVRTQDELLTAIAKLSASEFVALDTEFLRERTYFAQLCLIQAATDDYCVLIDVQAPLDLRPFFELLNRPTLTKVLHAAHQDLEIFAFTWGALNNIQISPIAGPIVDTQVCAGFSGHSAQIGYADLVKQRLNHSLDKGQSRTDWSQRPLSADQLRYAADDVIYLVELYHDFQRTLVDKIQWAWMTEDAEDWIQPSRYLTDPEQAWKRLRGLEQLAPTQFAAAQALAAWREQRAVTRNLPRSWILSDIVLRQLCEQLPKTLDDLTHVRELAKSTIEKRGQELLDIIATAAASASDENHTPWQRPSKALVNKVTRLMEFVRSEASRINVSSELLTTRKEIEQLVFNHKLGDFAHGWRREVFGEKLIKLSSD